MMQWKCLTHDLTLTEEGNKRTFVTPPGSIRGMPPCQLLTIIDELPGKGKGKSGKEEKFGDCLIEKVS